MPQESKETIFLSLRSLLKRVNKSRKFYLTITAIFGLFLFFFIHIREVKVPMLDLGVIAPKYVVAEIPFVFLDEEATTVSRQEALLDIGKIYMIDREGILQRGVEFENSLIYDQLWRNRAPQSTFDEMCRANEKLERTLLEIRFTDLRTLEKMKQLSMDSQCVHEIGSVNVNQEAYFPDKIWEFIRNRAFYEQTFQQTTVDFLISFFREKVWVLKEDIQMMRQIRKKVQDVIPPKYTSIQAGSRIIDFGEKVTTRHITMLQAMKQAISEKRNLWHPRTLIGSCLLAVMFVATILLFLHSYQSQILKNNTSYLLYITILMLSIGIAKLCEILLIRMNTDALELFHYPLLTPMTGILLCILLSHEVALFSVALLSVLYDTTLGFDYYGFLLTNILTGFVVVFYTKTLKKRLEVVGICFKGWVSACIIAFALYLYDRSHFGMILLGDCGSAGSFMLLTAVFVIGILPFFESFFQVLTDINLMEYMDPNHELLRRLMVEAPGTYQHSIIAGGIAEAGAQAIGCNGLFCRAAALYHDIGKVSIAQYFTENQQSGMNIHQLLTPVESAKVIISHVQEGVTLARKARLPEPFIDIIQEHHGTGLVYYFYHKQLEAVGHDHAQVNIADFCYSGPKPHTKESGIIMIADSFEAASRSLEELNETTLKRLIDQIVKEKMDDGQLDDCRLTFEELSIVKTTMIRSLLSIGHFRIKYPTRHRVKGS